MRSVALAVGLGVAAAWAVGCASDASDPFGPEPDFGAVESRFAAPDGTFGAANAKGALASFEAQRGSSAEADLSGATSVGGAAGTQPQSIALLDMAQSGSSGKLSCAALSHGDTQGTCACPKGGSFVYDFSGVRTLQQASGPVDVTLKLRLNQCDSGKNLTLDGREFVRLHAERAPSGRVDASSTRMLLVADLDATRDGVTHAVDLAARIEKDRFDFAVRVDDGWIVVSADRTGGGTVRIRAKNGTFTCSAGKCTAEGGASFSM